MIESSNREDPTRLIIEETLEELPKEIRAALIRHLAFSALQFALVSLCISVMAHRCIVSPVRELASATQRAGVDGN